MTEPVRLESREEDAGTESRSSEGRGRRILGWTGAGVFLLVLAGLGAFGWYTTTANFEKRVNGELVRVLQDATGGRVEVGEVQFDLRHLAVEADGLVIHGLEGPGEAPYLSADKMQIRIRLFSFFQHTAGAGLASHVSLDYLRVDRPEVHLIVYKDGKTNQPTPKHPQTSRAPLTDTLLDLKAKQVILSRGIVLLNDKAIPFDVSANDLGAEVHYVAKGDMYVAAVDLKDLRTRMAPEPEAQSSLHLEVRMGRDKVELKRLELDTGKSSKVTATGNLTHFAKPEWQAKLDGSIELTQVTALTGIQEFTAGRIELDLDGHSCSTSPAVAQKHSRFWQRLHRSTNEKANKEVLPPDPECQAGYLLIGKAAVHDAGYRNVYVRLAKVNGGAQLSVTPTQLLFTALTGYLPEGGRAEGRLRISNWLGEVSANAAESSPTVQAGVKTANITAQSIGAKTKPLAAKVASVQGAHAYLDAVVSKLPLRTIMDATAPEHYGDLGFDTSIDGPVKVEWGGPAADISDTVQVDADLTLAPTGVKRRGALSNIPVRGKVVGHYDGKTETVAVQRLTLQSPGSTLDGNGTLGVNLGDKMTSMRVDLAVRDLGEFDQLLQTLGFTANGKKGRAAIPIELHGGCQFLGTARGEILDLDVKGHLLASNLEAQIGTAEDIHVDSLVADGEYSPFSGLAIANSSIKEGSAALLVAGTFRPSKGSTRQGVASYAWDDGTAIDVKAQLANAKVQDLLAIAGEQHAFPLTGMISLSGHASGPLKALSGAGHISLVDGDAYGEPYQGASADFSVRNKEIEATQVVLRLHGMQIAGNGGYDLATERVHGHLQADNLALSKFETLQRSNVDVNGLLSFAADANGTLTQPGLRAQVRLKDVTYEREPVGQLSADLHSEGDMLFLAANSTLLGTKLDASGQMHLAGAYEAQGKLTFAGLDLEKPLALWAPDKVTAQSAIGGVVTVSGPLKTPKQVRGAATFNNFDVKLDGVELKSAEPVLMGLKDGVLSLQSVHIVGEDTDLRASGTAQIFGAGNSLGGNLNVKTVGSVSVALLHTFDADILSSGRVKFAVNAGGKLGDPTVTGRIEFEKVNLAMDGINNGLTAMEGSLIFNEDRLQVENLTAQTGGGQLKIGGSIRYRGGVYADLTAIGDAIRVRYYGLSTTANAKLKLQGNAQAALLSGDILVTRFGIGPDVDFAAFAGAGGVSAPADPNAPSNKIRLDVHVTSSPQLDFQNSYAKLAGTADLRVRGTVAEPTVLGRIQINDGSATFAGTKYQLQRGDIYFTNPVRIDPIIDLDATARVENYDVTIGLHGTVTNLKPTYRSEPPLSESDVFALLALGRTQEEAQLYQEQQVQMGTDPTTSSLLGGALNATVSNRVEKLFGVGSVKIDPAFVGTLGGSSARITVQQQLSRQLTATYATNVNTQAQQLIQLQYDVNHNVSIVATRDETGVFSVVYKLRRRYR